MKNSVVARLPTKYGNLKAIVWPGDKGLEPVAIVTPTLDVTKQVLVRIHSECLTGDVFGSLRCDCFPQKEEALKQISQSQNGVFIYLRQEGRGMGLYDKIRSYKLQEEGHDTHEASIILGHEPDPRNYVFARRILEELGIRKIKLLTNNPAKISEIFSAGFDVEKVPLVIEPTKYNIEYFKTKRMKFKHTFGEKEKFYYYGITYTDYSNNIKSLLSFLKTKRKHPFLRIHIGLDMNSNTLKNTKAIETLDVLFKRIIAVEGVIPVAHYNSVDSKDEIADIQEIKKLFPVLTHIQINDLSENYLSLLQKAAERFVLIVSLADKNFQLIDNQEFRNLIFRNESYILLDNSRGTGKKETFGAYHKKISRCLNFGLNDITLAGGFGSNALDVYFKARDYYKINFSIDAESQLQTNGKLDVQKAIKYFDELLSASYG